MFTAFFALAVVDALWWVDGLCAAFVCLFRQLLVLVLFCFSPLPLGVRTKCTRFYVLLRKILYTDNILMLPLSFSSFDRYRDCQHSPFLFGMFDQYHNCQHVPYLFIYFFGGGGGYCPILKRIVPVDSSAFSRVIV